MSSLFLAAYLAYPNENEDKLQLFAMIIPSEGREFYFHPRLSLITLSWKKLNVTQIRNTKENNLVSVLSQTKIQGCLVSVSSCIMI